MINGNEQQIASGIVYFLTGTFMLFLLCIITLILENNPKLQKTLMRLFPLG